MRGRAYLVAAIVLPGLLALSGCASQAVQKSVSSGPATLSFAHLQNGHRAREVNLAAFAPPADARAPTRQFEGTLQVSGKVHTRTILAKRGFLSPAQRKAARTFPDFAYNFVQDGNVLLPVHRGYINTAHPHWDLVLEPGRVWDQPGDAGGTRAALPFALVQKHMNCTHYGVLTFVFGDDEVLTQAAVQVSSETCSYLKFDMWGLLDASYQPHAVASRAAVVASYHAHQARRLPQRPMGQLATDYPGTDPSRLAIGEAGARTLYGLVVHGVHYVSPCPTRSGNYPYCDVLPLPSYSTAKSAEAALALMAMAQQYPGITAQPVTTLAPLRGCATEAWQGVTLRHLSDMTSGHFDSTAYMADEEAVKVRGFFNVSTEPRKAAFACDTYPRRAEPGTTWVYHTSDTFLLGDALNRYLHIQPGKARADIFRDVVVGEIYAPLGLSPTARTSRRTADAIAQPFFGYGLQFQRDDMARLASFVGQGDGVIGGRQVLDRHLLDLALQRVPGKRGAVVAGYPDFRYQLGFWARDVAPIVACEKPTWVPFMSGHGGISVVMYPNGVVYYNVADSGSAAAFDWAPSATVAQRVGGKFCH